MPYIGTPGAMVKIPGSTALETTLDRVPTLYRTVGGSQKAQYPMGNKRTWVVKSVEGEQSTFAASITPFIAGEYGDGPFVFVSDWAYHTNLMSREASTLQGVLGTGTSSAGGMQVDGEVWAGNSRIARPNQPVYLTYVKAFEYVPVVPGKPVTASVYVKGTGARVELWFYDAAKENVIKHVSSASPDALLHRIHITATPPSTHCLCLVRLLSPVEPVQFARPAVTQSPAPVPWKVGSTLYKAVITDYSLTPIRIDAAAGRADADVSFTITEVG